MNPDHMRIIKCGRTCINDGKLILRFFKESRVVSNTKFLGIDKFGSYQFKILLDRPTVVSRYKYGQEGPSFDCTWYVFQKKI